MCYIAGAVVEKMTHGKGIFDALNKKNTIMLHKPLPDVLPSVAVKSYTTLEQLNYFIEKMKENSAVILMFHSILNKSSKFYGVDNWYWDADSFEKLLISLTSNRGIKVETTRDMIKQCQQ